MQSTPIVSELFRLLLVSGIGKLDNSLGKDFQHEEQRRSVECHETYQKFQTNRRLRDIANNELWHKSRQENQQWTSRANKNKGVAVEFDRFIECNMVYVHGIHRHRHYMLLCAPRHLSRKMDKAIGIEPFTPGLHGCQPHHCLFLATTNTCPFQI